MEELDQWLDATSAASLYVYNDETYLSYLGLF